MVQMVAWITSAVFMLAILGMFIFVAVNSTEKREYEPIVKKWYKARKFYGTVLIIFMIAVTLYTIRLLPFNQPVYSEGEEPTIVSVEAFQFGWEMDQTEFSVGESIEFDVTSKDVNHGFGIYNEEMELIAQTQAMPNYTNTVYITFEVPGTYEILCLEYCGLAHHVMIQEIVVH